MGGKKQAQRVKNNAQPSSSHRSAQLLMDNLKPVLTCNYFMDFDKLETGELQETANLDPDFLLAFKKMKKSDISTRINGMKNFMELVEKKDKSLITKEILKQWSLMYCEYSMDFDARVRETVQIVHKTVLVQVKKDFAPFLKHVIGLWFLAQHDTSPPIANLATLAFKVVFNENKALEAVKVYQKQILDVIYEKLFEKPSENTINAKKLKPDELKLMKQKTITSCLYSYAKYLSILDAKTIDENQKNNEFISHADFWKLASDRTIAVKAGWFSIGTVLCEKHVTLLNDSKQTLFVRTVVENFDVCDYTVMQHVWKCFLTMTNKFPNWINAIDLRKSLLPKLWKVLREINEFQTNGILIVYPNLLNIIEQLPREEIIQIDFVKKFFKNFNRGLVNNEVFKFNEKFAMSAFKSYTNCIEYFYEFLNIDNQVEILNEFVIAIVAWSITNSVKFHKYFYQNFEVLLKKWENNVEQKMLVDNFERKLNEFTNEICESGNEAKIEKLINYLVILKNCGNFNEILNEFCLQVFKLSVEKPNANLIEIVMNLFITYDLFTHLNFYVLESSKRFLDLILEWNSVENVNAKSLIILTLKVLKSANQSYLNEFLELLSEIMRKNLQDKNIFKFGFEFSVEFLNTKFTNYQWIDDQFLLKLMDNQIIDSRVVDFIEHLFTKPEYKISKEQMSQFVQKISQQLECEIKVDLYEKLSWTLVENCIRENYDCGDIRNLIVNLYVRYFDDSFDRSANGGGWFEKFSGKTKLRIFIDKSLSVLSEKPNAKNVLLKYNRNFEKTFGNLVSLAVIAKMLTLKTCTLRSPGIDPLSFMKTFGVTYQEPEIENEEEFLLDLRNILYFTMYFSEIYRANPEILETNFRTDIHLVTEYLTIFSDNYRDNSFSLVRYSYLNYLNFRLEPSISEYSQWFQTLIIQNTENTQSEIALKIEKEIESKNKNFSIVFDQVLKASRELVDAPKGDIIHDILFLFVIKQHYFSECAQLLFNYCLKWFTLGISSSKKIKLEVLLFYEQFASIAVACIPDLTDECFDLLVVSLKCLTLNKNVFQLFGYQMCNSIVLSFAKKEGDRETNDTPKDINSLDSFVPYLQLYHNKIDQMVLNFEISKDFIQLKPYAKSYGDECVFSDLWGYLLMTNYVFGILSLTTNIDLRLKYLKTLKKCDFIYRFLFNVFYIMSEDVLNLEIGRSKKLEIERMFKESLVVKFNDPYEKKKIEHLACWLYKQSLLTIGSNVRDWWTNCSNQKMKSIVEKITINYCAELVFAEEIKAVVNRKDFKDLECKVSETMRTITSTYTFEDLRMELIIKLPTNYPLGDCQVEILPKLDEDKKVKTLKPLLVLLRYQHGNIYDAIQTWKANLDKKYARVDECYICFCVTHVKSFDLPKMCCNNCQKKFHSICLYKWFSTSNNSTCPICRSQF